MRSAVVRLAILGVLGALPSAQRPDHNAVDYQIEARLDGETKYLAGRETIRWTNRSGESVSELWFHLYLNAFANDRSIHLDEAQGKLRGHKVKEGWSWSRVVAAKLSDGRDLLASLKVRHPEGGSPEDRTVFSLDLPEPVDSGATIEVELEWESQLPRVRRRTGFKDDFMVVAQWFPKLGVYEAGRGWNCHSFHMNSEFYSDYGRYDVSLNLPAEYDGKVFGTGVLESSKRDGDRVVVNFQAPSREDRNRIDRTGRELAVHDFTWTADPNYIVEEYTFRFSEWSERFADDVAETQRALGPDKELVLRDVRVTVLIHPERADQAERHFEATSAALFFYGLWFGEYPYEHITVIDPAWGARGAGGMEYPTLFTCGSRLFCTPDMHTPEGVTVHEAGHQFWFGLVGNNEFEAAFLDEGFNSYTDSEVLQRVWGPRRSTTSYGQVPYDGVARFPAPASSGAGDLSGVVARIASGRELPLPWVSNLKPLPTSAFVDLWRDLPALTFSLQKSDPRWSDRSGYLRNPDADPLETFTFRHANSSSYRTNSYRRTAVVLRTLEGLVGREAFLRGMRGYADTWRYGHPYPADFYRDFAANAGYDGDLEWYFNDFFRGTSTGDWSVGVDQRKRTAPRGNFPDADGVWGPRKEDASEDEGESDEKEPWIVDLLFRRRGDLSLPMPIRMTFEGERVEEFTWSREEQLERNWLRKKFTSDDKLVSVEVDPDGLYFVDANMANNQWFDEKGALEPLRWSERVLTRVTHLLHFYAGIGG